MERFQNTKQPDWDWWGRLWPTPGGTLRRLGVEPGASIAEVGSGNGYFALPAARIADPGTVYAVDVDERLLDELETLATQQAIENVVAVHGDARELRSVLPEPVDVVLVANTFHGIDDPDAFVDGVIDALADGGRFVVVNWHAEPRTSTTVAGEPRGPPTERRLTPQETKTAVADGTELSVVETVELLPHHYGVLFEL